MPFLLATLAGGWLLAGCKPNLDQTVSIIGSPIVLAVRSDPAEGASARTPSITYTALYVDKDGPVTSPALNWAFCTARNPLANLGPVNPKCLETTGTWLLPIGVGVQVTGNLPADGCRQFGSDVPEPMAGQPQGRPVDPDPTGGYYQPVRFFAETDAGTYVGMAETRLQCALANGYGNVVVEYANRYHANANPEVASLRLSLQGDAAEGTPLSEMDGGTANVVPVGAHVALRVAWAACPKEDACGDGVCGPDETSKECATDCSPNPKGCSGAERFAGFDLASQSVIDQRESMAVAWFATNGTFDDDRTGRDSTDFANTSDNGWTAPRDRGLVHIWVILRDNRGGVGWADYRVQVD
jgi:hypothetical protein